jgi:hypothetical protein
MRGKLAGMQTEIEGGNAFDDIRNGFDPHVQPVVVER